jgi:hypothetical protein
MRPAEWFSRSRESEPFAEAAPRDAEQALVLLDAAIRRHGHDEGADGERFHPLVLAYCTYARDEHLTPEQMLVRLKHALHDALMAVGGDPVDREAMRTRVVQLAINAYYDDRR